jgi:putative PIN family toxin of toxin-antitoxin system
LRVTADTNIYVSALQYGGQPRRFLDMAREGTFELCVSAPILNEMSRVLKDKFGWTEDAVQDAREMIASFTTMVEPSQRLDVVKEDPTDNRILECALASGSRCVVTGDRHLRRIGRHQGIEILKVSDFLNRRQGMQR